MKLEALLEPGGLRELARVAEWHFRQQRQIPSGRRLSEAGFVFDNDTFALPPHWGFSSRGLLLHYNAGEVAPAEQGPTTVVAPWSELRGIVSAKAGILPR